MMESEPRRDATLGALLRTATGDVPADAVDWNALAQRISRRASNVATPWWGYAARWERLAIPLAVAAGLAGAVALWNAESAGTASTPADVFSVVLSGVPASDAASQIAQSMTAADDASAGEND